MEERGSRDQRVESACRSRDMFASTATSTVDHKENLSTSSRLKRPAAALKSPAAQASGQLPHQQGVALPASMAATVEERGSKKRRGESSAGSLYDTLSSSAPAAIISGSGSSSYLIPLSIEVEDEMESGPDNLEAGPSGQQQQHDSPSGMEVSETGPSSGQYRDSQQQQYSAGQQGVAAQHHHRRRLFCSSGSPTGGLSEQEAAQAQYHTRYPVPVVSTIFSFFYHTGTGTCEEKFINILYFS